jgi:hypothetical protein
MRTLSLVEIARGNLHHETFWFAISWAVAAILQTLQPEPVDYTDCLEQYLAER